VSGKRSGCGDQNRHDLSQLIFGALEPVARDNNKVFLGLLLNCIVLLDSHALFRDSMSMNIYKTDCKDMSTRQHFITHNTGIITTKQANSIGISNERLRQLVVVGAIERVSFGIYATPDEVIDTMYVAQIQRPRIIFSHDTALYLHDLTDRDPIDYAVTVPTGYNASQLRASGFMVFSVKYDLYNLGKTMIKTVFGNSVVAYNLERTICDCLRSRSKMDIAVLTDAIKRYAKRKDKNLHTLMQMAEVFRVSKLLRTYLEVLL